MVYLKKKTVPTKCFYCDPYLFCSLVIPRILPYYTTKLSYFDLCFDSYSTSWSDGETMYSYMYEWGNDRDCPKLYKCCNGQGGTGTCVRADGPEPGKGYSFFPN